MRLSAGAGGIVLAAVLLLPGTAEARWSAVASGSARIGATTLRNATGLAAACGQVKNTIVLSWAASPDSAFVSYQITRTGSPGTSGTLTAAGSTTTITDTVVGAKGDVYSYTIRAVVGSNWTTTTSAPVSRSFPLAGKCV